MSTNSRTCRVPNQTTEMYNLTSKVVFHSERNGNYDIFIMDTDGSNQIKIVDSPYQNENHSWSFDGSYVSYHSYRHDTAVIVAVDISG